MRWNRSRKEIEQTKVEEIVKGVDGHKTGQKGMGERRCWQDRGRREREEEGGREYGGEERTG